MKIIFSSAISMLFILGLTSTLVHATSDTSCETDVDQMKEQIAQYGGIFGHTIRDVIEPIVQTSDSQCSADAISRDYNVCDVVWEKGNWGASFTVVDCQEDPPHEVPPPEYDTNYLG